MRGDWIEIFDLVSAFCKYWKDDIRIALTGTWHLACCVQFLNQMWHEPLICNLGAEQFAKLRD